MEPDISNTVEELNKRFADWLTQLIGDVLKVQEQFTIALSGGNTPKHVYELLASPGYRDRIAWEKIQFFWGDERYVLASDNANNAKMAFDTLLNKVPVRKEQVHAIRTDIDPIESAREYEKLLHTYFEQLPYSFDLVMLGLGDDAHTLSLFPGTEQLYEKEKWVVAFFLEQQDMYRITMTAPLVNKAARVAFLVSGASKAMPVYKVIYGEHEPELYPAQLIQPYSGNCYWFLDRAAASEFIER